jgi:hypothetical protein
MAVYFRAHYDKSFVGLSLTATCLWFCLAACSISSKFFTGVDYI